MRTQSGNKNLTFNRRRGSNFVARAYALLIFFLPLPRLLYVYTLALPLARDYILFSSPIADVALRLLLRKKGFIRFYALLILLVLLCGFIFQDDIVLSQGKYIHFKQENTFSTAFLFISDFFLSTLL